MHIAALISVILLLAIPSSSLFTWKRTLRASKGDLHPETVKLCELFDAQQGSRNISSVKLQDRSLNLTFINSMERDLSKIVNIYFAFPPYMLTSNKGAMSVKYTTENSSFVLVAIKQSKGNSPN